MSATSGTVPSASVVHEVRVKLWPHERNMIIFPDARNASITAVEGVC